MRREQGKKPIYMSVIGGKAIKLVQECAKVHEKLNTVDHVNLKRLEAKYGEDGDINYCCKMKVAGIRDGERRALLVRIEGVFDDDSKTDVEILEDTPFDKMTYYGFDS